METSRQLSEALKALQGSIYEGLHVAMPATIESYEPAMQKASITINVKRKYKDGSEDDYPVISGVPVAWPQGGGASLTMPLARGDRGLAIFCDRSLDRYLTTGSVAAPDDRRKHALSDAWFIPGGRPFVSPLMGIDAEDLILKFRMGEFRIKPSGRFVLQSAATDLKELYDETLDLIQDLITEVAGSQVAVPSFGTYPLLNATQILELLTNVVELKTKLALLLE
jgi:hypothetical protein